MVDDRFEDLIDEAIVGRLRACQRCGSALEIRRSSCLDNNCCGVAHKLECLGEKCAWEDESYDFQCLIERNLWERNG